MKKTSFIVPMSAVLAGGLALIGIAAGVWQVWGMTFFTPPSQKNAVTQPTEETSPSVFQLHYVGYGGKFAKIPERYCYLHERNQLISDDCDSRQSFLEINLETDVLPVEKIQSAVVSGDHQIIAYAVDTKNKTAGSVGCPYPDLYLYHVETKQSAKLKNDPSMWMCGVVVSSIARMSQGGRYLFIEARGPTEGWGDWVYDTQQDKIDTELTGKRATTAFSLDKDTANEDRYMAYVDACMDFDDSCHRSPKLMLRDNVSGKATELLSIEAQSRREGFDLQGIQRMEYSPSTGGLTLLGDVSSQVTVSDFRGMVQRLTR